MSPSCPPYVFLVKVRHKRYSCARCREWKGSSSHFVAPTCYTYLLVKSLLAQDSSQTCQLLHFPPDLPSAPPRPGVFSSKMKGTISPAVYADHQNQKQPELMGFSPFSWVPARTCEFQLVFALPYFISSFPS